jgi:DNA-binding NtrC family response regulator
MDVRTPDNRHVKWVLIIDDDPGIQGYLKRVLEADGYGVRMAGNGRAGLDAYRHERADLVITDIFMDHQDGLETIRRLRTYDPAAIIVAMSGGYPGVPGDYLSIATKLGAAAAWAKPFDAHTVLRTVRELLAR